MLPNHPLYQLSHTPMVLTLCLFYDIAVKSRMEMHEIREE